MFKIKSAHTADYIAGRQKINHSLYVCRMEYIIFIVYRNRYGQDFIVSRYGWPPVQPKNWFAHVVKKVATQAPMPPIQ